MIAGNDDRTFREPDFKTQRSEWAAVPIDDQGYFTAAEMRDMTDADLLAKIQRVMERRYSGWRNYQNRWRECLGLDSTVGKRILDFGCGVGIEAAQFAGRNDVIVADPNWETASQARRVLSLLGFDAKTATIKGEYPFVLCPQVDVFYANGVLHHIPYAEAVLRRAEELLLPGGEVRLMLYTDAAWTLATGTVAPDGDPREHPAFMQFVRRWDPVGYYAESYWPEKLERMVGDLFTVDLWMPVTRNGEYAAAILRPRAK